ncbi:MAG TPA: hypothetical protein ENF26_03310 [Methanomicrobia archaeon]|nr:hypothetical protein [Methanomicrobia archaeon]HEX59159.1 hypothetical protein [Methanomicrobia archaeon]
MRVQLNPKLALESGWLKPCEYTQTQQIGIDLSVERGVILAADEWQVVRLNEAFRLPSDVFALLFPRSTMFRKGLVVECGVVEPGYIGRPVVAIHNRSDGKISLPRGTRVVQAIFFRADAASTYEGSYQGEGL